MQVEVLVVRQAVRAHVVEQHIRGAHPVAARDLDERLERVALPRVVERRDVDVVRQVVEAAQLEEPLGVHVDVAQAAAGRGVVVLEPVALRQRRRVLGEGVGEGAGEAVVDHGAVEREARVHHPVVGHALPARQLEPVEAPVVLVLRERCFVDGPGRRKIRRVVRHGVAPRRGVGAGRHRRPCREVGRLEADGVQEREVVVAPPDVVRADGEPAAQFAIEADDDLVGRVVLVVLVNRIGGCDRARVSRVVVAGEVQHVGEAGEDLVGLDELVAVGVIPWEAHARGGHRVDLAGDAAGADLAEVARVIGVRDGLAVPLHVVGHSDARGDVVEPLGRVRAAERDGGEPLRQDRVRGDGRAESLVVVVVVAQAQLERGPAMGQRVLHVGRQVLQLLDRVPVARQVRRAPLRDVTRVGRRERRAVVAHACRETRGRMPSGHADRLGEVVAPVAADPERVIAPQLAGQEIIHVRGQAVRRTDVHALRARPAVDSRGRGNRG